MLMLQEIISNDLVIVKIAIYDTMYHLNNRCEPSDYVLLYET